MTAELSTLGDISSLRLAKAWCEVDPDSDHRSIIRAAIAEGADWVADLFQARLGFGTAGIRGRLGPGPGAMNQVLVRAVAAGLATFVVDQGGSHVVIGFDARHSSHTFATDIARVLASRGIQTSLFDRTIPTPLVAFAVPHLGAAAGVMVTASHNPATDNGLKVYGSDGALLGAPHDKQLATNILAAPLVHENELTRLSDVRISEIGDEVIQDYLETICAPYTGSADLTVAYTPLHGVGHELISLAFERVGFAAPIAVESQRVPDPDFPTAPFPNPEEPGALAPLITLAASCRADLAIANDPDADRLAVAVPHGDTWRLLSGDEVGCLLADYLLAGDATPSKKRHVRNTIVSSRLLAQIAQAHGAAATQTLTGFKWLMHPTVHDADDHDAELVLAYEEALGYCIGGSIRDKDGIAAALAVASMASNLKSQGLTLLDALDDLHRRHGVHVNGQRALRFESAGGPTGPEVMQQLREVLPVQLGGQPVRETTDLSLGESLPATNALVFEVEDGWLAVRPSGTEPKLKIYGETWTTPVAAGEELGEKRRAAYERLEALISDLCSLVADLERRRTAFRLGETATIDAEHAHERATALFDSQPAGFSTVDALRLTVRAIDLTTLAGDDTVGRVRALCAQARRPDPADPTVGPTAAVCVYPNLVATAVELTRSTGVSVASVAGAFPSGLSALSVRLADIDEAVGAGADEIDVVINRAALLAGDNATVLAELKAMRDRVDDKHMKVILETSELATPAAIEHAANLAIAGGADWIKTSTGKSAAGATPTAVFVMAQVVASHVEAGGEPIGIKISGGVRTAADALGYLAIIEAVLGVEWLDPSRVRFGASGLVTAVVNALRR